MPLKYPIPKISLIAGLLAVACLTTDPTIHAADNAERSSNKTEKEAADLAKYDRNHNGKLDPDEKAAMKADANKQKTEKKPKGVKKEPSAGRP